MKTYKIPEQQLKEMLLEAMSKGMDLRQKQLLGGLNHNKSGREVLTEWFDNVKLNLSVVSNGPQQHP